MQDLVTEPVQPVRLLGENLTLFRDAKGSLGLIGDRCAHRGASLAYGIPQDNGLRCAYHGWTYNTEGRVVDMPFEPACLRLKVTSYPVEELGGLVWAYMGPVPVPLLPKWQLFARTDLYRHVEIRRLPCNWLQCMDNSLDPVHFEHLHGHYGNYYNVRHGRPPAMLTPRHAKIDFDVFEYGIYKRRLLEGQSEENPPDDWTIGHPVIFPHTLMQGTWNPADRVDRRTGGVSAYYQIRVPTDDTNTMHIEYAGRPRNDDDPVTDQVPVKHVAVKYNELGLVDAPRIPLQDEAMWIGQGPINDRTAEHLATSDKGIILFHKMLLENMAKVERGEDPIGVIRDPAKNEPFISVKRERVGYQEFQISSAVR